MGKCAQEDQSSTPLILKKGGGGFPNDFLLRFQ